MLGSPSRCRACPRNSPARGSICALPWDAWGRCPGPPSDVSCLSHSSARSYRGGGAERSTSSSTLRVVWRMKWVGGPSFTLLRVWRIKWAAPASPHRNKPPSVGGHLSLVPVVSFHRSLGISLGSFGSSIVVYPFCTMNLRKKNLPDLFWL